MRMSFQGRISDRAFGLLFTLGLLLVMAGTLTRWDTIQDWDTLALVRDGNLATAQVVADVRIVCASLAQAAGATFACDGDFAIDVGVTGLTDPDRAFVSLWLHDPNLIRGIHCGGDIETSRTQTLERGITVHALRDLRPHLTCAVFDSHAN